MALEWDNIVADLGSPLLRYFSARFPRGQAGDLVQEVFLRLVVKTRDAAFDESKGSLRQYAFGIARFVALEAMKGRVTTKEQVSAWRFYSEETENVVEKFDEALAAQKLRHAMMGLSKTEQEVLALLVARDLSLAEIGELVAMPVGTVKSHIHRAKENLRMILATEKMEDLYV